MKTIAGVSLVIVAVGTAAALALTGLSEAQEAREARPRAITECKEQLPENRQYTMNIDLYIDTRQGEQSTLDLVLLDGAAPESVDIPRVPKPSSIAFCARSVYQRNRSDKRSVDGLERLANLLKTTRPNRWFGQLH